VTCVGLLTNYPTPVDGVWGGVCVCEVLLGEWCVASG